MANDNKNTFFTSYAVTFHKKLVYTCTHKQFFFVLNNCVFYRTVYFTEHNNTWSRSKQNSSQHFTTISSYHQYWLVFRLLFTYNELLVFFMRILFIRIPMDLDLNVVKNISRLVYFIDYIIFQERLPFSTWIMTRKNGIKNGIYIKSEKITYI